MKTPFTPSHTTYLLDLPETARAAAAEAARLAFPHGTIETPAAMPAISAGPGFRCLVVLSDAGTATGLSAGEGEAPRCAVVVLGTGTSDLVETVPPAEWNAPSLARAFRSALLQHDLLCENLRLRGDLKTVARRISHDLRTPIGCIHTTSDMLPELDAASLAGMGGVIKQSSLEISQIIDRVSFLLKASADPLPSVPVEMDLLVDVVLQQLDAEIKQAKAVVQQPATWPEVAGVAAWLQVIWWNLLHNALQHGGPGIRLRLGWDRTGEGYRFFVADSGPGVTPTRQTALFLPFEQLHVVRTSGLGLSLVHRLVSLQGGQCHYGKAPEGGANFSFTLPVSA